MSCQRRTSPGNIDWGSPNFGSERSVELFCCKLLLTETTTSISICEHLWIRHWLFSPRARSRKARKVLFPLIRVLNERPHAKIIKTRNYKSFNKTNFQRDISSAPFHVASIHRRTGRWGEGGCSPPKFWATQIFWATRENLGKASF